MRWWPSNPEDSKNVHISVIAGLVVAILIIAKDFFVSIGANNILLNLVLFGILVFMLIYFMNNYRQLREGLDNIDKSVRKNNKKK